MVDMNQLVTYYNWIIVVTGSIVVDMMDFWDIFWLTTKLQLATFSWVSQLPEAKKQAPRQCQTSIVRMITAVCIFIS